MIWLLQQVWHFPSPINVLTIVLLILALVVVFSHIVSLVLAFRDRQKLAPLYEARNISPYYIDDVAKAKEVWVAWHTASYASISGDLTGLGHKITRMILLSPNGNYVPIHAQFMRNIKKSTTISGIEQAKERLHGEGVKDIRYIDGYILVVNIYNPRDDKKGWIRIEPWSPFLEAGSRPIFYIKAKQHPIAFKNLRDSYDEVWNELSPT